MDAVILAGGKGTRMGDAHPKALVPVRGKPIIDWQINYLQDKADKIIVSLGHRAQEVVDHLKDNYPEVLHVVEQNPLGTAGGLKLALQQSQAEKVLVINCDDITNIDLKKLSLQPEHTLCAAHPTLPFGLVDEKGGFVVFREKPVMKEWTSCGWYLFIREDILSYLPDKGMLEYDVFPKLKLRLFKHQGFWQAINSKKDAQAFEEADLPQDIKMA